MYNCRGGWKFETTTGLNLSDRILHEVSPYTAVRLIFLLIPSVFRVLLRYLTLLRLACMTEKIGLSKLLCNRLRRQYLIGVLFGKTESPNDQYWIF